MTLELGSCKNVGDFRLQTIDLHRARSMFMES